MTTFSLAAKRTQREIDATRHPSVTAAIRAAHERFDVALVVLPGAVLPGGLDAVEVTHNDEHLAYVVGLTVSRARMLVNVTQVMDLLSSTPPAHSGWCLVLYENQRCNVISRPLGRRVAPQ